MGGIQDIICVIYYDQKAVDTKNTTLWSFYFQDDTNEINYYLHVAIRIVCFERKVYK